MNKYAEAALDIVYEVVAPLAGSCPVCAFCRGVLAGLVLALLIAAAALVVVQ